MESGFARYQNLGSKLKPLCCYIKGYKDGQIKMKYGYCRVSTFTQAHDGNSLQAQQSLLKEHGAEIIHVDRYTGTKLQRPEFDKLLKELRPGDTLIVSKLDRFARSVSQATDLITSLIDDGIRIDVCNLGVLDNSSMSTFLRNLLLCFAQFERDLIVERTQEGKAIARQKPGFHEGRPKKYSKQQMEHALGLLENNSFKQVVELTGISISTLKRAARQSKINGVE